MIFKGICIVTMLLLVRLFESNHRIKHLIGASGSGESWSRQVSDSGNPVLSFNAIPLHEGGTFECLRLIKEKSAAKQSVVFHLVNTYTCTIFSRPEKDNPLLHEKSVNLLDGHWLRRYLEFKTQLNVKAIRGPELFECAFSPGLPVGSRHLLIGSTPDNLKLLEARLLSISGNRAVIRGESLPFRPMTSEEILDLVELIEDFQPNVVWVGLGTPKQDFFAQELCDLIRVPLVCVGAAFDFVSGGKKTAPIWMQKCGFEWLFRLASEPKRLWKRYLLGNLRFVLLAVKDRWSN